MGLKATITQLINDKIRNKSPKVVKVEHADVEQAVLDNGYIRTSDSHVTQTYTTKSGTVIQYVFYLWKSHGTVNGSGIVKVTSTSGVGNNTPVFTWKLLTGSDNNEFICGTVGDYYFDIFDQANSLFKTRLKINELGMTLPVGATAGMTYTVNFSYPSKY